MTLKNKFVNHLFREVKVDLILTRKRGTTPKEWYAPNEFNNMAGASGCRIGGRRFDNVIVREMSTNKFVAKMPTKEAKRIYGIVPEKRKKIHLHITTFGEYTDYKSGS